MISSAYGVVFMNSASFPCRGQIDWRTLYRAAILETDKAAIPERVAVAEDAIIVRQREIFYSEGSLDEKDLLEDALYALRALRNAARPAEGAAQLGGLL